MSLLACLHLVPWNPRKLFLTKLESIEPGMTVEAVQALLDPYVFRESRSSGRYVERSYWHSRISSTESAPPAAA